MNKTDIDRLGERLRDADSIQADDLVLLDEYRRSLAAFSREMTTRVETLLLHPISERPGKTTPSIVAKLKRQPIALSRIQDVTGGRTIVPDLRAQEAVADVMSRSFPNARVVDRRASPIVGYHALHFVLREGAKSYELQVRTIAQQRWAQLSEKFADIVGFEIKYGGGPVEIRELLTKLGQLIYLVERTKFAYSRLIETENTLVGLNDSYVRTQSEATAAIEISKLDDQLNVMFARIEEIIERMKDS